MREFTLAEYIEANSLGVSPHDPAATRIIRQHLLEAGFHQRRVKRNGKFQLIWSKEPRPDYDNLRSKLSKLP